jgi:hypothetical protein
VNIFAVDRDPVRAARALCDRHVVKMTVETAQILCTAAQTRLGQPAPYRPTHAKHPCVEWVAACRANWSWLVRHGRALADEYTRRYGRVHPSRAVVDAMAPLGPPPSGRRRTPFAQAMPEAYRGRDAVAAYRRYYVAEKAPFATWKPPAGPPPWWPAATPSRRPGGSRGPGRPRRAASAAARSSGSSGNSSSRHRR